MRELEKGPVLARFLCCDHGSLLQIAGERREAVQYEIGNPLTASRMTRHRLPAALYAPLRVVLYEDDSGQAAFEYDRPVVTLRAVRRRACRRRRAGVDQAIERALLEASR